MPVDKFAPCPLCQREVKTTELAQFGGKCYFCWFALDHIRGWWDFATIVAVFHQLTQEKNNDAERTRLADAVGTHPQDCE